jgi:ParB family chromosome partitioning protein
VTAAAVEVLPTELDPKVLAQHPANIRRAKGDIKSLVASIDRMGILQPIVVEQLEDGSHQVLAGHRRLAAALELKLATVPVRVVDLKDDPAALAMLAENTQRTDLTVAEEADAYLQLQADGLDVATIAKDTGVDVARVEGAVKASASKTATTVAHKYDLNLEQTLVLAEFDDDREAVKELTEVALKRPGQFDHTASRLRQRREAQRLYDETVARLQRDKVKILKKGTQAGYSATGRNCRLDQLKGADGKDLTEAKHKDCPGHAAALVQYNVRDTPTVVMVCTDPKKHGHKDRWGGSGSSGRPKAADMTEAERAKASAERKAVIQNNKDWKAATPVRLEFVRKLLARKAPPKGTLRFATETIAAQPRLITEGPERVLEDLVGSKGPQSGYHHRPALGMARKGADGALPMALLALVCAGVESAMEFNTWRSTNGAIKPYFAYLKSAGYELAPVEEILVKGSAK